jgi:hypothetical protein
MRSISSVLTYLFMALVLALSTTSHALDSEENTESDTSTPSNTGTGLPKSVDQIAREMTNPLAPFTYFDWHIEYRTYQGSMPGASDQTQSGFIFQPVIPFRQKNGKGWVLRFSLPYYDDQPIYYSDLGYPYGKTGYAEWRMRQEDPTLQGENYWNPTHGHTDDLTTELVYGGVNDDGLILQYGLAVIWPVTTDTSNGRQQFILGPEVNIGKMADWGVYGALVSHVIDVAEKKDDFGTGEASQTTIQAYFSYGLGNGWQLISNPIITYDWEGDSGNKLNLPLGLGISKTSRIGNMPLRVSAEIQKYVASTDRFATDWMFRLTISPVLPNKYTGN